DSLDGEDIAVRAVQSSVSGNARHRFILERRDAGTAEVADRGRSILGVVYHVGFHEIAGFVRGGEVCGVVIRQAGGGVDITIGDLALGDGDLSRRIVSSIRGRIAAYIHLVDFGPEAGLGSIDGREGISGRDRGVWCN